MRLIYLGWPRSGSSWLHDLIKSNSSLRDLGGMKESHLFYTDPQRALAEFTEGMMDFSTNNWSMDSWVARQLKDCRFIFLHRHPLEIMISYHSKMDYDWDEWQRACEFNNLLNVGNVLERWIDLVGDGITVYEFADLVDSPERFGRMVLGDLGLSAGTINPVALNESNPKPRGPIAPELLERAQNQEQKFQNLAGSARFRRT